MDRLVTFASKITVGRMLLIPVFAFFAVSYGLGVQAGRPEEWMRWAALVTFVVAAASDGIDGWVARRFNQRSDFGAYIDPIADKALLLTAIISLSVVDWGPGGWRLPLWFTSIVVARDCIILGGIRILYSAQRRVKIAPHWSGKVCTVTQMFAVGWIMLKWVPFSPLYPSLVAGFFTVWSAAVYIQIGMQILRGREA